IIKDEILKELENLKLKGVTDHEMKKTKNSIKSGFIFSLQNLDTMANQLNYYNFYLGEPNSFNNDLNRYNSITNKNIMDVTGKYFSESYIELRIKPKAI
ncbi:MAG TPA: insulinase family protein, partial [Ignavibacteriaceae bacterium]